MIFISWRPVGSFCVVYLASSGSACYVFFTLEWRIQGVTPATLTVIGVVRTTVCGPFQCGAKESYFQSWTLTWSPDTNSWICSLRGNDTLSCTNLVTWFIALPSSTCSAISSPPLPEANLLTPVLLYCSQNSGLYQAGLTKCLFPIWCHGAWAHVLKDLPSLNISCKIKVAHTCNWKCVQESYQPYVPPCAWKSQECGSFLPLPGILRQFCLEFLAADESCTKGSASSRSRPTLRATARTQPHKFLHNFSGFSLSQHSKPSPLPPPRLTFWHFPSETFDSHSP